MPILLGAIADDFTGATDLANTLVKEGMGAVQTIGVPDADFDVGDADAVVVALKSRTVPAGDAVRQSLAALEWLRSHGAGQFFFKYCSTFDSTDAGNIGPVADALLDALGAEMTIACPAFPTNGRTVYRGYLFVGDELLSESSMKDHPLTPMRDANLVRVLARQTPNEVGLVTHDEVSRGAAAIGEALARLKQSGVRHAIVDAISDRDLYVIGQALQDFSLVTGGSGIALGLPENFRRQGLLDRSAAAPLPKVEGRSAILAGSCSVATRTQLSHVADKWPAYNIEPSRLAAGDDVAGEALSWASQVDEGTPAVIYSSSAPEEVARFQEEIGRERAGALVEDAMAAVAVGLVEKGVRRLVVAGGETSGAVVSALGVRALRIGPEIDPGVPWTEAAGDPAIALALKSGNFGGEDFFIRALEMLP